MPYYVTHNRLKLFLINRFMLTCLFKINKVKKAMKIFHSVEQLSAHLRQGQNDFKVIHNVILGKIVKKVMELN